MPAEGVDVHHVEAGYGDALQQNKLQVLAEAAPLDRPNDPIGSICPVPAHPSTQDALETQPGEDGPDQVHVAAVGGREWAVVEADGV
jgi:hypothetical protein